MSVAEVYITSAIHYTGGDPGSLTFSPAEILAQLTQYDNLKIAVPRKGYRTASFSVNLQSAELAALYADGGNFNTYSKFLYIKWRGHVVFWGPIIIKEVDYEANSITLQAKDQGARLEHRYFRIGNVAMDDHFPLGSTGHLPVSWDGIHLSLMAGEIYEDDRFMPSYVGFLPLGVRMGFNHHTDYGRRIRIDRGQEIWRTMLDLGDRTDGPLFEFVPLTIEDGTDFAVCNVYGQFRNDISDTVKFHYGTGLNNVRNMQPSIGGELLSHVVVVTQDKAWRTTSYAKQTSKDSGVWVQWEQVDWNLDKSLDASQVTDALGAVGDSVLDAYGRPFTSVVVMLRRDDQIQDLTNQFYWIDDFKVADVVEISGQKGHESFTGKYLIDVVRLEQESDGSGQLRQFIDVIPHVPTGLYSYRHDTARIKDFPSTPGG